MYSFSSINDATFFLADHLYSFNGHVISRRRCSYCFGELAYAGSYMQNNKSCTAVNFDAVLQVGYELVDVIISFSGYGLDDPCTISIESEESFDLFH